MPYSEYLPNPAALLSINTFNTKNTNAKCTVDSLESMTENGLTNGTSRNDASSFISSSDVTGLVLSQQANVANNNNSHLNLNDALNIKSDYGLTTL